MIALTALIQQSILKVTIIIKVGRLTGCMGRAAGRLTGCMGHPPFYAARPPLQNNTYPLCVFMIYHSRFCAWHACVFGIAHGVGVLFALNLYGNAQAGALLILHIARLV